MARIYAGTDPAVNEREARNRERSRKIAAQGMVLLQDSGILPLRRNERVALYGWGARHTVRGGTGSGDVNCRDVVNVEKGLMMARLHVVPNPWLDRLDAAIAAFEAEREKRAEAAVPQGIGSVYDAYFGCPLPEEPEITEEDIDPYTGTAIYVISRNSGEGRDRRVEPGDYLLRQREKDNLEMLARSYGNLVIVLNVGGVIDTRFLRELPVFKAILLMSQAGSMGGLALGDVLTGRVNPCGRLTTTWADRFEDYPSAATFGARNGDLDDEAYSEGIYVGYRYFDTFNVTPAFPFGYGLSYSRFQQRVDKFSYQAGTVSLQVSVRNCSMQYAGREVVQVYCSAPGEKLEKPYQQLVAFAKTKELAPGRSETLEITFPLDRAAGYNEAKSCYELEQGIYVVRVGTNARDTVVAGRLALPETVCTAQLSRRMVPDGPLEEITTRGVPHRSVYTEETEEDWAGAIPVDPSTIPQQKAVYRGANPILPAPDTADVITAEDVRCGKHTLEELVGQLTPRELMELCTGAGLDNGWDRHPVSPNATMCPGAAGATTARLLEQRNIRDLVLADGPAGLRLEPQFLADPEGNIYRIPFDALQKVLELGFGQDRQSPPADAVRCYQYCTAIPIATLLAQTWDLEAVQEAGAIVGEEMEAFGVDLWLAPGMNIHRNPLCGRNFEYYSEDPLLAGLCAAADTMGVQQFAGRGTTIKHFALNNQEDNRLHVNARASERAIREIYLKGFQYAVQMAQPKAIMSSYNLVNGVHTANTYDLLTAIARDEWGFQGLIMTDWGTTEKGKQTFKYGSSNAAACVKAGNDLTMPGSPQDVEEMQRALEGKDETCSITLGDLQACAMRVLRAVLQSHSNDK